MSLAGSRYSSHTARSGEFRATVRNSPVPAQPTGSPALGVGTAGWSEPSAPVGNRR